MKTRFAPSPTGFLHLGSVRTALFAWLMARHHKGEFFLRIEDTDSIRSKPEYTDLILHTMAWLGLNWDGDLVYQSKRYDRYNEVIDAMVAKGQAYYCHCSPERLEALRSLQKEQGEAHSHYDGACREKHYGPAPGAVVRLKIAENADLSFHDQLHGYQQRDRTLVDDWIMRRSDGHPTYNFAVVVDDHDMAISHVIRGDDHLNNTPKQVALYQILNWNIPLFYHIPMILDESGARLSKRSGSANILQYREQGYLPGALLNALVRLGWSHGDQELFSMEEMIALFDGASLQNSPACFNPQKFHWIAKQWIMKTSIDHLVQAAVAEKFLASDDRAPLKMQLCQQRIKNFEEIESVVSFLDTPPKIDMQLLEENGCSLHDAKNLLVCMQLAQNRGEKDSDLFSFIKAYSKEHNIPLKSLALTARLILTGSAQSPDLNQVLTILTLPVALERISDFIK